LTIKFDNIKRLLENSKKLKREYKHKLLNEKNHEYNNLAIKVNTQKEEINKLKQKNKKLIQKNNNLKKIIGEQKIIKINQSTKISENMFLLESLKENVEILYKHTNIKYNKLISDCKFLENIIINEKKKINYNSPQYNFYQCMEINVFNYIEKLKNYPDVEFQQFGEILKDLNLINITKSQEIEDTEKKINKC